MENNYYQRSKLANVLGISKETLHVLLTAYWELFYESFIHGMSHDEMTALCQTIAKLIDWKQALGLPESLPD